MSDTETAALKLLADHTDPKVQEAGAILKAANIRRRKILNIIREAVGQLRLDMKYVVFDLEATRRERDELKGKV
jgi:hypothetical protein